jgi:hypothetical protein
VVKKLILAVLVAGLGWWWFIGGRQVNEEHVHDYYRLVDRATGMRDPKQHCDLLHDDFQSSGVVSTAAGRMTSSVDKKQSCEAYVQLYDTFEKLGAKMGGIVQLDSHYEIHSIEISPDRKTANVDLSYSLDVAGSLMNIRSRSTDTLVRRNGQMLMLRSEGRGTIGSGG